MGESSWNACSRAAVFLALEFCVPAFAVELKLCAYLAKAPIHLNQIILVCRLMFTSPLHQGCFRASFMHRHYSGTCTTSAIRSILELIICAVERMDPGILQRTENLASNDKRLERCWQMELYRVLLELLPRGRVVSPDVGRVCTLISGAFILMWLGRFFPC